MASSFTFRLALLVAVVVAAIAAALAVKGIGVTPAVLAGAVAAGAAFVFAAVLVRRATRSARAELDRTFETQTLAFPPPSVHGARARRK